MQYAPFKIIKVYIADSTNFYITKTKKCKMRSYPLPFSVRNIMKFLFSSTQIFIIKFSILKNFPKLKNNISVFRFITQESYPSCYFLSKIQHPFIYHCMNQFNRLYFSHNFYWKAQTRHKNILFTSFTD